MKQRKSKQNKTGKYFCIALFSTLMFLSLTACLFASLFYPNVEKRHVVRVPDLVGKKDTDCQCDGADFEIEKIYVVSSDEENGRIISQTPKAGTRRKVIDGERVKIEVHIGQGRKSFELPNLSGLDEREAVLTLKAHGCKVFIVHMFSSERPDGEVIDSFPTGGETVFDGSKVTLYVAKSKEQRSVKVPDFCGLSYVEALDMLALSGLNIGSVTLDSAEEDCESGMLLNREYTVSSQSLIYGTYVKYGSKIDFCLHQNQSEDYSEEYISEDYSKEYSEKYSYEYYEDNSEVYPETRSEECSDAINTINNMLPFL